MSCDARGRGRLTRAQSLYHSRLLSIRHTLYTSRNFRRDCPCFVKSQPYCSLIWPLTLAVCPGCPLTPLHVTPPIPLSSPFKRFLRSGPVVQFPPVSVLIFIGPTSHPSLRPLQSSLYCSPYTRLASTPTGTSSSLVPQSQDTTSLDKSPQASNPNTTEHDFASRYPTSSSLSSSTTHTSIPPTLTTRRTIRPIYRGDEPSDLLYYQIIHNL